MVTSDHPLLQLLALIEMVWAEPEAGPPGRGAPKWYSEKDMFKVYLVSLLKSLWARRSLWRFLQANPTIAAACGLPRIPHRRTLDRRLEENVSQAEAQIRTLGLVLSMEHVTNGATAASDGSVFQTPGPVWHKKDKEAGVVPEGLHGLDRDADWICSGYHGWVYGYKAHVTTSVSTTTVRVVLDATVTGSTCESHVLQDRLAGLPPTIETLLLDAGYDDRTLIERCTQCDMTVLVPLSKPIGRSTSQARRDRAAYLASVAGKAWYKQRATIEPFFATIKDFFKLDPLPVQGTVKTSAFILFAFYAWNLIVLFNFLNDRPLGAVKSVLDWL